jgi:hypothetical protein
MNLRNIRFWTLLMLLGLCGSTGMGGLTRVKNATSGPGTGGTVGEQPSQALATSPLSASDWLTLAEQRQQNGEPLLSWVAALSMSRLSGSNEGEVMAGRAELCLSHWDDLPPSVQIDTVADIIGGWDEASDAQRDRMRALAADMASGTRQLLRSTLLLAGKDAERALIELKLGIIP